MERLRISTKKLLGLCSLAVKAGRLQLLKWLQRQQPPYQMTAEVCEQALSRGHSSIVLYLVAELMPPVFPGRIGPVSNREMLLLAKAACPMDVNHIHQLRRYTMVHLHGPVSVGRQTGA